MSFLFGKKPKQTQTSQNTSHSENSSEGGGVSSSLTENTQLPFLSQALSGLAGGANRGMDLIGSILGLPGSDPALGEQGFNRYKDLGGFNFALDRGMGGITANRAAQGLLNSGGTQKKLVEFGTGLQNQYLNQYLQNAMQIPSVGLQAADILKGAGVRSSSDSSNWNTSSGFADSSGTSDMINTGGKPGLLSLGAMIAKSDRRLKTNIKEIERDEPTGLMIYEFEYKNDPGKRHIGVMAQEVAEKMPEALGPLTEDGYMTVDYAKVWGLY